MKILLVVASLLAVISLSSSASSKERVQAAREMWQCTFQNCQSQATSVRSLFKTELDGCMKTCNANPKQELSLLADEDLKDLKNCFQQNNCKLPLEQLRANGNKPQVQALRLCAVQRCGRQVAKAKNAGVGS